MPPSSENICQQSTQYHFVNDYLYRPVNTEEVNARPNVTLRYGDRYHFGSSFEADEEYDREEEAPQRPQQFRQQQPVLRQRIHQLQPQPTQQHVLSTPRPLSQQQQQPQQQFARQPSPNQVFHSSEEINIPLQQRRPVTLQSQRPTSQQQQQQEQLQQQQQQNDFDFRRK